MKNIHDWTSYTDFLLQYTVNIEKLVWAASLNSNNGSNPGIFWNLCKVFAWPRGAKFACLAFLSNNSGKCEQYEEAGGRRPKRAYHRGLPSTPAIFYTRALNFQLSRSSRGPSESQKNWTALSEAVFAQGLKFKYYKKQKTLRSKLLLSEIMG